MIWAVESVTRCSATSNTFVSASSSALRDVVGLAVGELGDIAGDPDQPAQQRGVLDDAGVAGGVGDRRGGRLQLEQGDRAADLVEQAGAPQFVGDRHRVDRLAGRRQHADGLVDVLMGRLVEVARR